MEPTIQLDKVRALRYSSRALRLAEARSGQVIGELLISRIGVGSVAWLLWAALIHSDPAFCRRDEPDLTVDDVCDLLDEHWFGKGRTLRELTPFFTEAVLQAGYFTRAPAGKASPETGGGSPVSGQDDSGTPASPAGSPS